MKRIIVGLLTLCLILMNIPYAQAEPTARQDPTKILWGAALMAGGAYLIVIGVTISDEEKLEACLEGEEAKVDWLQIIGGALLVLWGTSVMSEYYVGTARGKSTDNTYLVAGKRF